MMCATTSCACPDSYLVPPATTEKNDNANPPTGVIRTPGISHPSHIPKIGNFPSTKDFLALVTHWKKNPVNSACTEDNSALTTVGKLRTIIETSQPVHAMAILAVITVASTFFPSSPTPKAHSGFTTFLYLTSFSLHFGSQFWMTFVSGLTLFFSLTRHAFGDVQKVLFPRYFTINSIFSLVSLLTFSKLHSHIVWETRHWVQITSLSACFLLECLSRLYVAPQVLTLMEQKKAIEIMEPGVGQEIGSHQPGRLINCPHYMAIHSNFRRKHSMMAIANVLAMVCTTIQLVYMTQSICLTPS